MSDQMFFSIIGGMVIAILGFAFYNIRLFMRDPNNADAVAKEIRKLADSDAQIAEKALRNNLPLAATVLMYAVADTDHPISDIERAAISHILRQDMALEPERADAMVDQAYRLYAGPKATKGVLLLARDVIGQMCSEQEKVELIEMLTQVAKTDGPTSDKQAALIAAQAAAL